jgi:hypothetical protein
MNSDTVRTKLEVISGLERSQIGYDDPETRYSRCHERQGSDDLGRGTVYLSRRSCRFPLSRKVNSNPIHHS